MYSHFIKFTEQNNTGIIKLNRPNALNALNYEMAVDFLEILSKWKTTHSIKRVLLLGEGEACCAGGDVKNLLTKYNAGIAIEPSSVQEFKKSVYDIFSGSYVFNTRIKEFLDVYSMENVINKFNNSILDFSKNF